MGRYYRRSDWLNMPDPFRHYEAIFCVRKRCVLVENINTDRLALWSERTWLPLVR